MSELENLLQSEKQKQMLDTDESLKNNRHLFTIRKKRILKEIFLACFYFFLAATSCITVVCNVLPYDKSGIKSIPYEFIRCAQDDDRIANGFDKTKQIRGQDFDTFVGTCKNLNTLEFPSKINEIANDAYWNDVTCDSILPQKITNIIFEGHNIWIGEDAFHGNRNLLNITITNVEYIGNNAFQNCSNISSKLTFSDNLIQISGGAFNGCSKLTELDFFNTDFLTISPGLQDQCFANTALLNNPSTGKLYCKATEHASWSAKVSSLGIPNITIVDVNV